VIDIVPSLFLAHGSPMLAIEDTDYSRFLADLGRSIRPKAAVVFTAHWESEKTALTYTDGVYETIHDFGGFPDALYAMRYPAKGSVATAEEVERRLTGKGIEVRRDPARGLDHGTWTLLSRLYPEADIPVVQVSVHPYWPAETQYRIGEALRGLGDDGILVIGSGVTVHNLRLIRWQASEPERWAAEFDDWLIDQVSRGDREALFEYERLAPHAKAAVPRPEHFVPFLIAYGIGNPAAKPKVIYRGYEYGTLSYLCCQF
jgi:4,5-DOPA dioxygenase extradiol